MFAQLAELEHEIAPAVYLPDDGFVAEYDGASSCRRSRQSTVYDADGHSVRHEL